MNVGPVLIGILISYFPIYIYGTIRKMEEEDGKKRKTVEIDREEKEKDGWKE